MSERTPLLTEALFDETIKGSDKPVLVDFYADWCGPCHVVAPVLDEIAADHADQLVVAKLDVDESPGIAQRYGVMSIPTLIFFRDDDEAQRIVGALPKVALESELADVLEGSTRR